MSLIRISASRSQLPAWLGLFAILLLFIAPVISKSLAQARGGEMPMMMMGHHAGMAMDAMPHAAHTQPGLKHSMPMMDDSACGYCVLLIHLPLNLSHLPELWSLLQAAAQPVLRPEPRFVATVVPFHFRARAPPLW